MMQSGPEARFEPLVQNGYEEVDGICLWRPALADNCPGWGRAATPNPIWDIDCESEVSDARMSLMMIDPCDRPL